MPETAQEVRERLRREGVSENVANEEHENLARRMASPNRGETAESIWASSVGNYKTRSQPNEIREESSGSGGGFGDGGGGGGGNAWSPDNSAWSQAVREQNDLMRQMWTAQRDREAQIAAREAEERAKRDELFGTLKTRAAQNLNIDPNDPTIKGQVDVFRAEQDRALRDAFSDAAEAGGGLGDTRKRMSAERVGQAVGGLQAELMARELTNRRNEIASSLQSMGGILDSNQQIGLQRELANYDTAIRQYQLGQGNMEMGLNRELGLGNLALGNRRADIDLELGRSGLQNDLARALMQNQQFYSDLNFRGTDRTNYWNAIGRGLIRG